MNQTVALVVGHPEGASNLPNYILVAVYCTSLGFFLSYCSVGFKSGRRIGLALWFLIIWGCVTTVGFVDFFDFKPPTPSPVAWANSIVVASYFWTVWCLNALRGQVARRN